MDVVGGGAGVAAQQLASVFTHAAELHVVIVLLLGAGGDTQADLRYHSVLAVLLEVLKLLVLGFPLDPLLLLKRQILLYDLRASRHRQSWNFLLIAAVFVFLSRQRCTHTVRAAPLALGGLVQLRLQADEVVRSRTSVAQDDLAPLLTHLAVVLVIRLVAVPFLVTRD